jgi:hypothetical protein
MSSGAPRDCRDCRDWREQLELDASDGLVDASDHGLAAHLAECEACRTSYVRRARLARLLRTLARRAVPGDLEGRVVAAFHAGRREDRAVSELERLGRRAAPAALERRVARELNAPPVLDRLVAESLGDLPRTIVRGMTGKLARHSAPESLAEHVEQHLLFPGRERRGVRRTRAVAGALLLVAALSAGLWIVRPGSGDATPDTLARWSFTVERGTTLETLDPRTRKIIEGLLP